MGGFHGYRNYEDWYDNGPGSESFKRNVRLDSMRYDQQCDQRRDQKISEIMDVLKSCKEVIKSNQPGNKGLLNRIDKVLQISWPRIGW